MRRIANPLLRRARIVWRRYARPRADDQIQAARGRAATLIGAVALGLVALAFATLADWAQLAFGWIAARIGLGVLVLSPAIFAGVVWVTRRYAPGAAGSGIPQVIAAGRTHDRDQAMRLVSLPTAAKKLALTLVMLLAGASVGREGPTVQVSAAVMVWVNRVLRVPITTGTYIAGGAAGVAAAFNTPLAGVAFAIEELAAAYEQRIAILVMGAVMIAGLVSLGVAGDYVYFGVLHATLPLHVVLLLAPLAGVAGGLTGGGFARVVLGIGGWRWRPFRAVHDRPVLFAALCGLVVAALGVATGGESWGTGYGATRDLVEGHGVTGWFGPAKIVATLATTLSGAPGGIFAPSLAVGAGLGNLLKPLFSDAAPGAVVTIGMVAYFVGVVRAPFTAVIIVSETTAARGLILPMFATALIADWVSGAVCRERLYHGLSERFLKG